MKAGRNPQDIAAGALFCALGIGGLLVSTSYRMGTSFNMGPGYFPTLVFGLLTVVGGVVLARGLLATGPRLEAWNIRALAVVIGSMIFFALTVRTLGFVAAGFLMTLAATFASSGLTLLQRVVVAAVITAFSWALFILGLGLTVPVWPEFPR